MEIKSFENFINEAREEFRWILKGYSNENRSQRDGLKRVLKKYLDKCCSSFEEVTLKENLKEEFSDYLDGLAVSEGE